MDVRRVSFEALHDQLFELLRKPMSLDELVEELGPDLDASDDPHGLLRWVLADDRRLMWMSDDVYCRLDSVYDGITFSHRLTADEIERGVIADVDEWSILIDHFETVRVGDDQVPTSTTYVEADRAVLIVGLESVLADCSPGTVCGLAVDHSGLAFIPVVEEATIPDDLTSAFTEAFNAAAKSPTWPVAVADVLRSGLLLDRPRWLGTLPPLTELAVAAGYQSRRSQAASSSFEWDLFEAAGPTRVAATQFHLDTKRQQDLHITVDEYRKWRTSGRVAGTLGATPTAALLADPAVGEAFVAAQVGHGEETLADLASFASMIADGVDPDYRASCLWIRSLAAEEAGDFDTHERLLREAIAIDPGHDAAITALGWLLFDKSNLVEAFQRLDEVGDESELVDVIAQLTAPARSGAGRNDPCACGSGQKFKRCHGGQTLSAGDRIDLLYQKVARPLLEQQGIPDWWTWPGGWPTGPASWHRGLEQLDERGVLIDILLDEGGGMQEFLDRRGALLPADEVGFLRLWVEISRQVWQVVSTDLEAGTAMVELADQSSGSPIEIDRLAPSGFLDEGDLLIARLLPIENGGAGLFGGTIVVTEDELVDALTLVGETDLSASETARRFIEFARLHEDPAENQVVCFARFDVATGELDGWLAEYANLLGGPSESELAAAGASLDRSQVQIFVAYDSHLVARLGTRLVVVSTDEEAHRSVLGHLEADLPPGSLVTERGVTLAVLQDEVEAKLGDAVADELFDDQEAFSNALLDEAMAVLMSEV